MAMQELNNRVKTCENRLVGVHNLAGRLMAVDLVAAELGIAVPEPQMMTHQQIQQIQQQLAVSQQPQQQQWDMPVSLPTAAAAADGRSVDGGFSFASAAGGQQQQSVQPSAAGSRPGSAAVTAPGSSSSTNNSMFGGNSILQQQQQQQSPAAGFSLTGSVGSSNSRPQSGGVTAGALTKSRQAEIQQQIDRGQEQTTRLQQQLGDLQQQVKCIDASRLYSNL